jgi:hypothetical protein
MGRTTSGTSQQAFALASFIHLTEIFRFSTKTILAGDRDELITAVR